MTATGQLHRRSLLVIAASLVPFLAGCWGIGKTLHEAKLIEAHQMRQATIHPGETTRAEVLELLGQPWLSSPHWRFDVHRVTDYDHEIGVMFFLYWPIAPAGSGRIDWEGYALITWNDADVVASQAAGKVNRNDYLERGQLILRADELTLATYQPYLVNEDGLALWTSHDGLQNYLERRTSADACTVVLACDRGKPCPDRVTIDGGPPFDPGFVKLFCVEGSGCRDADSDPAASKAANRPVFRMPLLHPLELAPGEHRISLADRLRKGTAETTFSCLPGQVLFARVQAEVVEESFWRGVRLQPNALLIDALPRDWSNYGVVLWRDGRWFVTP